MVETDGIDESDLEAGNSCKLVCHFYEYIRLAETSSQRISTPPPICCILPCAQDFMNAHKYHTDWRMEGFSPLLGLILMMSYITL